MKAWHFVNKTLRDGSPIPPDGEWLVHRGDVVICESGLHASERVIDALRYAPGSTLCRVELRGEIIKGDDKVAASERKVLWRIDAEPILWEASRKFALSVIHLWDDPAVVREFLETGNDELRAAARDAACAARAAAWDAARAAARDAACAAWAAARAAAWDAAWDAAWAAARDEQESILLQLIEKARA